MPKTIDEVIAEAEIRDVHLRFCRANDRRDEELMRGCFHPGAVIELHEPMDVDAFIALGRVILSKYTVTWHNTGNQLVEVDGDAAWAEHYTISSHRIAADDSGPERDFVAYGRYIDRMERREGAWRIARRKMLVDFTRTDALLPDDQGLGSWGGTRDRGDPSYALRLRP
ncbi:nuclear transport factor 2 family protein [Novosphingobium album (ex Liu et al. 2023)]|uniref:Nuclear transport factor 2 family protein n=1 Tax=Novosphingobium album (ex Liu et al. 2023) TaxID=3031130 RepID=A0ABT5WTT0_9SPHN|nr:nuclear transport factor 2 family protein [Novosphingobium album (ex Liu et al. 2023)]MDE8653300.1 nuclear transport factor 2 family protein [Novosphingobium album (ex Liu et al. 2023)]